MEAIYAYTFPSIYPAPINMLELWVCIHPSTCWSYGCVFIHQYAGAMGVYSPINMLELWVCIHPSICWSYGVYSPMHQHAGAMELCSICHPSVEKHAPFVHCAWLNMRAAKLSGTAVLNSGMKKCFFK